jgi:hypothetical protein
MAKNPATEILSRWQALDAALTGYFVKDIESPGLNVPDFARRWKVSTKTIYRDLKAFRYMGQRIILSRGHGFKGMPYTWEYASGVGPLFVETLERFGSEDWELWRCPHCREAHRRGHRK